MKDILVILVFVIVCVGVGFGYGKIVYDKDTPVYKPIFSTYVKTDTVTVVIPKTIVKTKIETLYVDTADTTSQQYIVASLDTTIVTPVVKNRLFVQYNEMNKKFWLASKYEVKKDTMFVIKTIPVDRVIYKNSLKENFMSGGVGFAIGVLCSAIIITNK
jgi:hypothetical protein